MPTSPTPITALPTMPARNTMAAAAYVNAVDDFLASLPGLRSDVNDLGDNVYDNAVEAAASATAAAASELAAGGSETAAATAAAIAVAASSYIAESATSFSVGTGSKAFTIGTGKGFAATDDVVVVHRADSTVRLYGAVTTYSAGVLTVNVTSVLGSGGPFTDWLIYPRAFENLAAASVAQIRSGAAGPLALTVANTFSALAEVTLTNNSTTIVTSGSALDHQAFINAYVQLTGNWTLPNLTNPVVGQTGRIRVQQDGTGGRTLSFGANWKPQYGITPTMPATASAIAFVDYDVVSSTYIRYSLVAM